MTLISYRHNAIPFKYKTPCFVCCNLTVCASWLFNFACRYVTDNQGRKFSTVKSNGSFKGFSDSSLLLSCLI